MPVSVGREACCFAQAGFAARRRSAWRTPVMHHHRRSPAESQRQACWGATESHLARHAAKKCKSQSICPAEVRKYNFFSVFLCQGCREIWREILVKFSVLRFPGFGCDGKFHQNFTSKTVCKTENFMQVSLCWGATLINRLMLVPYFRV